MLRTAKRRDSFPIGWGAIQLDIIVFYLLPMLLIGGLVFVNLQGRRRDKNGEWHLHLRGTGVTCMRRWNGRAWEYRQLSDQEAYENMPATG